MAATDPPVRFAVPTDMFNIPSVTFDVNIPPVIFDAPVTFPLVRVVVPLVVSRFREPPSIFKMPDVWVRPAMVPFEIQAVPLVPIFKLSRLMIDIRVPFTTLAFPINVPPERFDVPEVMLRP